MVDLAVLGYRLDQMASEAFPNLNDSVILSFSHGNSEFLHYILGKALPTRYDWSLDSK